MDSYTTLFTIDGVEFSVGAVMIIAITLSSLLIAGGATLFALSRHAPRWERLTAAGFAAIMALLATPLACVVIHDLALAFA